MHTGKPHHPCQSCGRQLVEVFAQDLVAENTRALVDRLLLERLSLRGLCRAVGVTRTWLLGLLVPCVETLPDPFPVQPISGDDDRVIQRLQGEADAMASVVPKKANTPWIGLAMDATTRQGIAWHVGARRRQRAKKLGAKIPQASREQATFYTDQ